MDVKECSFNPLMPMKNLYFSSEQCICSVLESVLVKNNSEKGFSRKFEEMNKFREGFDIINGPSFSGLNIKKSSRSLDFEIYDSILLSPVSS